MLAITRKYKFAIILFLIFFSASMLLFFYTFYVDRSGNIKIASKLWSDFGSTFPIIRSFSLGTNFPPQYPIFSGPPIRYHFGFYAVVGLLERLGVRIDIALNTLSAVTLAGMLVSIYLLAFSVFKKHSVAALTIIFTIFNGSLGFIEYFIKNPFSSKSLAGILNNNTFSSFGPYDGKVVSAFWNLNIYTNQRHLALAYATFISLLLILNYYGKRPHGLSLNKAMIIGLIVGLFPFIHMAVFGMLVVLLGSCFLLYPRLRLKMIVSVFVAATIAFPMIVYMGTPEVRTSYFHLGYLIDNPSFAKFIYYWFMNLGLNAVLPFIGFALAAREQRKIFIPFVLIFIIGNIFRFSPEIAANHKFINLYFIGSVMFTAFALRKIWDFKVIGKLLVPICIFFLTLSGVIDFFPIFNDSHLEVIDVRNSDTANFILNNTNPDDVLINARFLYDPATVAGRRIYLGWPYFSWSAGYNTDKRFATLKEILSAKSASTLCSLLRKEGVDFVELENPSEFTNEGVVINYPLFEEEISPIFTSTESKLKIFDTDQICQNSIKPLIKPAL